MNKFAKVLIASAVAGLSFAASAGLVIDDFSVAQGSNTDQVLLTDFTAGNASGFYQSVNGATTSIVGGQRDLYVEKLSGGSGTVDASVEGGFYRYSTPAGVAGTAFLKWDGANALTSDIIAGTQANFLSTLNPTGLGGLDFNAGAEAFLINVQESDIGFRFALTVFSGEFGQNWTTLLLESEAHSNGLPAGNPILFADFEGATDAAGSFLGSGAFRFTSALGAADLSDVGALLAQINFDGGLGTVDLSIGDVSTVPEPGSLALLGLGLLGMGAMRRRKSV